MPLCRNDFRVADLAVYRCRAVAIVRQCCVTVIDRHRHLGGVTRLVGDNDFLLAVCRREDKAAVFVKRDRHSVDCNGINIFFGNRNPLCLTVSFAVLNA